MSLRLATVFGMSPAHADRSAGDANLSKLELCVRIKEQIPEFTCIEAPIGKDPDQRDYIVSNEKIERTGYRPAYTLDMGIQELIKAYAIIRARPFANA
jgi:hypothetical protein